MTDYSAEFQIEILKYLVQLRDGKKYISLLDANLFDNAEYQVVFELVEKYVKKYDTVPKKINLNEFFNDAARDPAKKVTREQRLIIETAISKIYDPFDAETKQIKEKIVEFSQYKKTKKMFTDYSPKLKEGIDIFKKIKAEMVKITQIGEETELNNERNKGGFLLKDIAKNISEYNEGTPIFLKGVNKLTAAKGFFPPQLNVLMSGPKAFKTGLLIKIGIELVRDGYKVYYADAENGVARIKNRMKQAMLEITTDELKTGEYDNVLIEMAGRFRAMGGEMVVDHYPPKVCSANDVNASLEALRDEHGWVPDVILVDYVDLFKPVDVSVKEKRLQLQAVYFDFIRLNGTWNTWSMSPTPVTRQAINSKVIKITDFGEDIGKAYNCHSAWAICRTDEEKREGIARLIPVTQRDGVSYVEGVTPIPQVTIRINEATMSVEEVDFTAEVEKIKRERAARISGKDKEDN